MAGAFAESALAAIELSAALDQVSKYALTPLGAARVCAMVPRTDRDWIDGELGRVADFAARRALGDDVEPVVFPDGTGPIARLRLEGSVLDGAELAVVQLVLAAARQVGAKVRRLARVAPSLTGLEAPALPGDLETALARAIDPDGRVRDEASRDLARLRREVVTAREAIVTALQRLLAGMDARHSAPDAAVTVRAGRYVIPVRREARGRLRGIVHDESGTQTTLFVEPAETMELGNRLREVEAEEAREVQRILRALTARLRPHAEGLEAALEMLVAVDACYARACFALALGAVRPRIVDVGSAPLVLRGAAHPLLFTEGRAVVRFDLALEPGEQTLLLSGPNTGGKTVLIKAAGLIAALAQCGVLPPVQEGSVLPVFTALFADIGDRQSIAESLSTFSAHVAALREVLARADHASLVLLDELGTGTDPAEGAALAAAALRSLTRRGAITVATTHLGALKELAESEPGIVNASLEFDAATLAPTYRFAKGVPGRSYGLAIARRLGVDPAVLDDAERAMPEADRRLDATLAAVETRGQALDRREEAAQAQATELALAQARLARAEELLAARERQVAEDAKALERARKAATRETLLAARAEVEQAIALAREGRDREARRALEEQIQALAAEERGAAAAAAAAGTALAASRDDPASGRRRMLAADELTPGRMVRIASLGIEGEIETVQGNDVAVRVHGRRVRVRRTDLAAAGTGGSAS